MSTDVRKGQSAVLTFRPPTVWASPTATVYDPTGDSLATPTPSVDSVSTTVASATNASEFALASASGVSVGTVYEITGAWGKSLVEVSRLDGVNVTLLAPLPEAPSVGDTVVGLEASVTVPATATTDKAMNYRVTLTHADGNPEIHQFFNVVSYPWTAAVTESAVRLRVSRYRPSAPLEPELLRNLTDDANALIRARFLEADSYVSLVWNRDVMRELARQAIALVCADHRIYLTDGADIDTWLRDTRFEFDRRVGAALHSAAAVDEDDDAGVDDDESLAVVGVRLVQ